ncbi:flagellar export chaperone FlgN [Duganella sp. HH101]|uniref:flagellar export chaperone FlgN n=1 Tax=Duganella sp. HH101 TaxID=1781066 RepID=UPI00089323B1|nr:flagellar export chaperone FlgN [Duganella sp. HH101]OEZ96945.1 FlgN protein [Duganella sp. HH101]
MSEAGTPGASPMTRQDAMRLLLAGIADDLLAYPALSALLEQQFDAAVRHRGPQLASVAEEISALVDRMLERRAQRVALVQRLLGPTATMMQAFALLKNAARERMEADWKTLEQMVIECKRLGKRNSDLLVEQYSIMQRVLHGEEQIYAPA